MWGGRAGACVCELATWVAGGDLGDTHQQACVAGGDRHTILRPLTPPLTNRARVCSRGGLRVVACVVVRRGGWLAYLGWFRASSNSNTAGKESLVPSIDRWSRPCCCPRRPVVRVRVGFETKAKSERLGSRVESISSNVSQPTRAAANGSIVGPGPLAPRRAPSLRSLAHIVVLLRWGCSSPACHISAPGPPAGAPLTESFASFPRH